MGNRIRIGRLIPPAAMFILVSCGGGVSHTNVSSRVQIALAQDVSGCQFLGDVHGFNPWGGLFAAPAYRQARANAIEQAENLRATHVVWVQSGSAHTIGGVEAHAMAYRCAGVSANRSPDTARNPPPSGAAVGATGRAPDANPPRPRSTEEILNKEAAAATYLDAHGEAVKRDLYEYNERNRLTRTLGAFRNYVLHDTEVLGLVAEDVMVEVNFDYGTMWNARFASKVVRMRWTGSDLKIVGHK